LWTPVRAGERRSRSVPEDPALALLVGGKGRNNSFHRLAGLAFALRIKINHWRLSSDMVSTGAKPMVHQGGR